LNWVRLVTVIVGTGFLTSLTDWFFAGDWIHRRHTYPEYGVRVSKLGRLLSPVATFPDLRCFCLSRRVVELSFCFERRQTSCCGVADRAIAVDPHQRSLHEAAPSFVVSYSIGWLTKLLIVPVAVGWFLG
jgi:hypothetical protein